MKLLVPALFAVHGVSCCSFPLIHRRTPKKVTFQNEPQLCAFAAHVPTRQMHTQTIVPHTVVMHNHQRPTVTKSNPSNMKETCSLQLGVIRITIQTTRQVLVMVQEITMPAELLTCTQLARSSISHHLQLSSRLSLLNGTPGTMDLRVALIR
jgi:hypothetical protein